ncbi:hypothetical protein CsatB_022715 [Cannabis sativa]|uniref:uncharacterized protein LOC133032615 n=1 Tax=Cannabis sativa TaxID=3483 RepID=UPI0029CA05E6|nr:uncharacterized protein LOC133032615 [Cannabis sativa]XP_060971798.1 uncharacterized protein LOC133037969 [Cannabis sativa]
MSDLSDSQQLGSGGRAFDGESDQERDSFLPTDISEMEAAEIELGPMSSVEIEKMVRELTEPGAIDIRDSESTVSARDYLIRTRQAPDIEVEEVEEGWTTPARESGGEEEEAEGSGTDSVDDSQLNEPFSCEDLVSRVVKSDFTTFVRLNLLRLAFQSPKPSQRAHLPFTNPAIIPTEDVVISIPILRCGVTVPFHPFVAAILRRYDVSPFQLTPNSYRTVLAFYAMYMEYAHRAPSVEEFSYFYDIKSVGLHNGFFCFSKWATSEINGVEGMVSNMGDWKSKWFYVFKVPGIRTDFNRRPNRPARPTLNAHKKGVAEILGSLPVQDRDWRLLCTTAKLREHKLIPENASLQREPVYKEPSERQQERIDKRLSKQTPRETSDMTFLKSAPVLKIKQKGGTPASSPVVAQKRKSDVMTSLAADSSKKLAKTTQDKGKKVVIDSPVRPRDFLAMQEKLLAEIPYEELVSRSTELAAQSVALFMKAVATPSKETDSLKRQNAHFQENIKRLKQEVAKMEELHKELEEANRAKEQLELELKKSQDTIAEMARDLEAERESGKKQYDQAVSDYIYTTLSKVPDFDFSLLGDEAAEMAEAFRSMSPTRTQGNLPDEIEGAQAEEVENEVVSKIVDEAAPDETTPAA